jgi:hypothetical protein
MKPTLPEQLQAIMQGLSSGDSLPQQKRHCFYSDSEGSSSNLMAAFASFSSYWYNSSAV